MPTDRRLANRTRIGAVVGVGFVAGILSGFFGVGGGILIVPLAVWVLGFDQHSAHATSLAAIFLISASALTGYAIAGEVDPGLGLAMGVGGLIGSSLGASLMHRMSPRTLRAVFGVVLIAAGLRMVI